MTLNDADAIVRGPLSDTGREMLTEAMERNILGIEVKKETVDKEKSFG
jgi:hypothetical protein